MCVCVWGGGGVITMGRRYGGAGPPDKYLGANPLNPSTSMRSPLLGSAPKKGGFPSIFSKSHTTLTTCLLLHHISHKTSNTEN